MTTRKEIVDLMKGLPTDETWLPMFLERLKEKEPVIYGHMMEAVIKKSDEIKGQQ
jgi:hypothetical protein